MRDVSETEILLVEDNPTDAELTIRALQHHNLANRIHHVKDGSEALEFLFATGSRPCEVPSAPRVILLDLNLPRVGGMAVLRALEADPRTKGIPVIILTSSKNESDLLEGYSLGVNSYVQKPVQFEEFVAAVARLGFYWLVLNNAPGPEGTESLSGRSTVDHAPADTKR